MVWVWLHGKHMVVCRHTIRSTVTFTVFTREMSKWFGFGSSGGVWFCDDTLFGSDFYIGVNSGDVKMVWF